MRGACRDEGQKCMDAEEPVRQVHPASRIPGKAFINKPLPSPTPYKSHHSGNAQVERNLPRAGQDTSNPVEPSQGLCINTDADRQTGRWTDR